MSIKAKKKPHLLITAGPTREAIDPIRYISNRSTGLMGYELARFARRSGFRVTLISGPADLKIPHGVNMVFVTTALQMKREVIKRLRGKSALLMASAVSDYRPERPRDKKIKKTGPFSLRLVKNPDILKITSMFKNIVRVGFALESENLIKNAKRKLRSKKLDFIVANRVSRQSSPFGGGRKEVVLMDKAGNIKQIRNASKAKIAALVLNRVKSCL